MANDPEFTLNESIRAQRALRDVLDLPEEIFPLPEFVGMISDEIEQLRAAGKSDAEIAEIITKATGKPLAADSVAEHYMAPENRQHPGDK